MAKKTLVIGTSLKVERYSNDIIKRFVVKKHEVRAIGLRQDIVEGVKIDTEKPNYKANLEDVLNTVDYQKTFH